MKIVFASDHVGLDLKRILLAYAESQGHSVVDVGAYERRRTDYPVWGARAAAVVAQGDADRGVLICGTGVGISLAANKMHGIRCATVSEPYSAKLSRLHNNSNMLAMGSRVVGDGVALLILEEWLTTEFEGGRHQRRIDQLLEIDEFQQVRTPPPCEGLVP